MGLWKPFHDQQHGRGAEVGYSSLPSPSRYFGCQSVSFGWLLLYISNRVCESVNLPCREDVFRPISSHAKHLHFYERCMTKISYFGSPPTSTYGE